MIIRFASCFRKNSDFDCVWDLVVSMARWHRRHFPRIFKWWRHGRHPLAWIIGLGPFGIVWRIHESYAVASTFENMTCLSDYWILHGSLHTVVRRIGLFQCPSCVLYTYVYGLRNPKRPDEAFAIASFSRSSSPRSLTNQPTSRQPPIHEESNQSRLARRMLFASSSCCRAKCLKRECFANMWQIQIHI